MVDDHNVAKNENRELFREDLKDPMDIDNHYAPSVFVTKEGLIGMNVGGVIFIMSIREWHQLAIGREGWR